MPTSHAPHHPEPRLRIRGPGDLLQALPYLLGFHPEQSLVVVGLDRGELVVTMRMDSAELTRAGGDGLLDDALDALTRGGAGEFIAVLYDDTRPVEHFADSSLSWLRTALDAHGPAGGCALLDLLLVSRGRWRSAGCSSPQCCPRSGRELPRAPSPFTAAATVAGMVPLPDRAALAAVLEPLPDTDRARLEPMIETADGAHSEVAGRRAAHRLRTLVAEASRPGWDGVAELDDATAAELGAALAHIEVRDRLWLAVDTEPADGRELWRELARRLPRPYDAAALFLYGWCSWRAGNGALANVAVERLGRSDPDYSAGRLLRTALEQGVDPRSMPRLTLGCARSQ